MSVGKLDGFNTQFDDLIAFITKAEIKVQAGNSSIKQGLLESLNQFKVVVNSTRELHAKGMEIYKRDNLKK